MLLNYANQSDQIKRKYRIMKIFIVVINSVTSPVYQGFWGENKKGTSQNFDEKSPLVEGRVTLSNQYLKELEAINHLKHLNL